MSSKVKATFEIASWDETAFDRSTDAPKLTEAVVEKTYSGDIDGTSVTKWLMAYLPDESASFVGLERITGSVAGKNGSLVVQHRGKFADGSADAELTIVSGTEQLEGVGGRGTFTADPAGSVTLTLT
jgi:Protein of unknown function (DUF3224)